MQQTKKAQQSKLVTPLVIIGAFVGLVETVLTVGVVKTSGEVQVALTAFVIVFPAAIAGCFFRILWARPEHFYHPSEYGTTNPESFMIALRGRIPLKFAKQV